MVVKRKERDGPQGDQLGAGDTRLSPVSFLPSNIPESVQTFDLCYSVQIRRFSGTHFPFSTPKREKTLKFWSDPNR